MHASSHLNTMSHQQAHCVGTRAVAHREEHEVGQTYWCSYWGFAYRVEAVYRNEHGSVQGVQVMALVTGETWEHCTMLDYRRDRVIKTKIPATPGQPNPWAAQNMPTCLAMAEFAAANGGTFLTLTSS
jgi:hypothetical protein